MIFFVLSLLGLVPTFQKAKCDKLLSTTMARIKLLSSRRKAKLRQLHIDLEKLKQLGKVQKAQVWDELIKKEHELLSAYVKIEAYCRSVKEKLKDIADQSECPEGLQEPLAGLCFAASCCADLPELQELREIFAMKYGKQFLTSAQELGRKCLECPVDTSMLDDKPKQCKEQKLWQQQEQETQVTMDADECNQCPLHHEEVDSVMPTVEDMSGSEEVQAMAAVRELATISRACDEDLETPKVALETANLKRTSEGRKRWHSSFKRACKKRQASVNTCGEESDKAAEEPAMKGQKNARYITSTDQACNASQGDHVRTTTSIRHHEAPNQHLVLYVKQPVFSLPPQRPPPPPPPPSRGPPPPPPLRVASMPSSCNYMKHETSYTNTPLPLRCSTMAKNQYDERYDGSHVRRKPPTFEDVVAAVKH